MPLPSTTAGTRASELGAPLPQPRSPRDCKQVCLALVVSREGMPIGYEVFAGNPERGEVRSPQMRPPIGRARARRLYVGTAAEVLSLGDDGTAPNGKGRRMSDFGCIVRAIAVP